MLGDVPTQTGGKEKGGPGLNLTSYWKFDISLIQEVNASEVKLQALRSFFQKHGLHLTWGHPRVPGVGEVRNGPCRGGGCAILLRKVTVAVSVPLPAERKNCDRFHEAYVQFAGGVQLWVCSAYGFDSSQKDAQERTVALLQAIECRTREFPPGPKIVGMDVNCPTNKCAGARNMIGRGWCDLLELGSQLRGEAKPVAYENQVAATCIDTILANAESMPYFRDCRLLDLPIPQHKGIDATFDFPSAELRALQLVVPLAPKYRKGSGLEGIDNAAIDAAIDTDGNFRGPDFLDHLPQSTAGRDPGRDVVQKQEQDAMAFLEEWPGKEKWKSF